MTNTSPRVNDVKEVAPKLVDDWFNQTIIDQGLRLDIFEWLLGIPRWGVWLSRLCLCLGVSLVLAGVICFFAYNWQAMPPIAKFGLIETTFVASIVAAYYFKLDKLAGKMSLLIASVFVGVFFAVFGQIYQTGADAYQLFFMWALLIFPFALLAKFNALWAVWWLVANLALGLWLKEIVNMRDHGELIKASSILGFNLCIWGLRESFEKKYVWLDAAWVKVILVMSNLTVATLMFGEVLFFHGDQKLLLRCVCAFIAGFAAVAIFVVYRFIRFDLTLLGLSVLSSCVIAVMCVVKMVKEIFGRFGIAGTSICLLAVIAIFFLAGSYIYRFSKKGSHENEIV